jgi:hypothetical protein
MNKISIASLAVLILAAGEQAPAQTLASLPRVVADEIRTLSQLPRLPDRRTVSAATECGKHPAATCHNAPGSAAHHDRHNHSKNTARESAWLVLTPTRKGQTMTDEMLVRERIRAIAVAAQIDGAPHSAMLAFLL